MAIRAEYRSKFATLHGNVEVSIGVKKSRIGRYTPRQTQLDKEEKTKEKVKRTLKISNYQNTN